MKFIDTAQTNTLQTLFLPTLEIIPVSWARLHTFKLTYTDGRLMPMSSSGRQSADMTLMMKQTGIEACTLNSAASHLKPLYHKTNQVPLNKNSPDNDILSSKP